VLERSDARDIVRSLIVGDTDSVHVSSWNIRISRRREGMPLADAIAQIDAAVRLQHAVKEAFVDRRLYR
jgi:hypothetical protein